MKYKSLEELFEAIDLLPDTISYVKVPASLEYFNAPSCKLTPLEEDWRQIAKDVITKTLDCDKGSEVDDFVLASFFGCHGNSDTDPYYIQLNSQGSRDYANMMSRYGALD